MALFRKLESGFEKYAAAARIRLGDNPQQWENEILARLYEAHSFLGKFSVNLEIQQEDISRGYMKGIFVVTNAARPSNAAMNGTQPTQSYPEPNADDEQAGLNTAPPSDAQSNFARIPILVEDSKLCPLDVFIKPDDSFDYLTEDNLTNSLFKINNFQTASPMAARDSVYSGGDMPEVPSSRHYSSMGNRGTEKTASLLSEVCSYIPLEKRASLVESCLSDPYTYAQARSNLDFAGALNYISSTPYISANEMANVEKLASAEEANVALIRYTDKGFDLTMGNRQTFAPVTYSDVSKEKLASLDPYLLNRALSEGYALVTPPGKLGSTSTAPDLRVAEKTAGHFAVAAKEGGIHQAFVVNPLRSVQNGESLDLTLAIWEDGYNVQEKVAGVAIPSNFDITGLPDHDVIGKGVFIFEDGSVSEPVEVENTVYRNDSEKYKCRTLWGKPISLEKSASVKVPLPYGDDQYLFPATAKFVPLPSFGHYNKLASDADSAEKLAFFNEDVDSVSLYKTSPGRYVLEGTPLSGLGHRQTANLDQSETAFMLGLLGADSSQAYEKLAAADRGEEVKFLPASIPTVPSLPVSPYLGFADEIASMSTWMPKIASIMQSAQTIDTVLSLNFVTPDTMASYVENIELLEQARSKMAEMLMGARLGVPDLPEGALRSALRAINSIVSAINELKIRVDQSNA